MPRVVRCPDTRPLGLEACVETLAAHGFEPQEEESLCHAASLLRRLAADRTFLADRIVAELANFGLADESPSSGYGPQVIMLEPPSARDFFIRANIWPSAQEHAMRANAQDHFVYGLPHDHNFDFLTVGYFGPGYRSDYYEYEYGTVAGFRDEIVDLRFVESSTLEPGTVLHYRAHRDVHAQHPPESLSVSLNIMHTGGAQGWMDQYAFDLERRTVQGILSRGSSEAFVRIAVGLGSAEALDLAERFGASHPSDRMRLTAYAALASVADGAAAREAVWRRAEAGGSRMVAEEARRSLRLLA